MTEALSDRSAILLPDGLVLLVGGATFDAQPGCELFSLGTEP
jgi:hypothetical protein